MVNFFYLTILKFSLGIIFSISFFGAGKSILLRRIVATKNKTITKLNLIIKLNAFLDYIPVGFEHIIPKGWDHIIFVLGLFFFSTKLRPLVWQISAFTVAHTFTLALGSIGYIKIIPEIVEPLIALSIVFIAVENIFFDRLSKWRPLVIFIFGLLHGLGFASVLGEFGLPDGFFIMALLGFNLGVEIGQLTVVLLAFIILGYWFNKKDYYQISIANPISIIIGLVGAYWFIERVI